MKEYKKYFEFSGTISGTNYFLRNLLSSLVAFIGGYLIGYGVASQIIGYTTVGLFVIAPTLWYSFATVYKRASAVFPGKGTGWTVAVLISQILMQVFDGEALGNVLQAFLIIFGLVLIFSNSEVENHEG